MSQILVAIIDKLSGSDCKRNWPQGQSGSGADCAIATRAGARSVALAYMSKHTALARQDGADTMDLPVMMCGKVGQYRRRSAAVGMTLPWSCTARMLLLRLLQNK